MAREIQFRHDNPEKVSGEPVHPREIYKDMPMMDDASIHEVYRAIQRAKADMPARLVGWQNIENLTALGLSYGGRVVPGSAGRVVENLPTRLVSLRNKFRFQLSPEFSFRRVIKANAKISLDDVPPTLRPRHALESMGVYKEAKKELYRIMPELENTSLDEGTQALYAEDPWGMYNHSDFEAYAVWHWKQQDKTDTEIRALVTKDFGYGSKQFGEGRSAFERSANFVFFPVSFDKTLYRNFGSYLMDHTAQRLILQRGLELYNNYNIADPDGSKLFSSKWWIKHGPVAQEALRLNAFAHGIGLGQFGGINAPILNLFIPQSYNAAPGAVQTLKGFIPAITEFGDVYKEITQQGHIVGSLYQDQNWIPKVMGGHHFMDAPELNGLKGAAKTKAEATQAIFFSHPVAETSVAQLQDAYVYRRKLNSLLSTYIQYNAHHADKYKLSQDKELFGQWTGSTINATPSTSW